jgi:hypothetical protein
MDPKAQKVIDNCTYDWPANQGNCSGFVKAVCDGLGVAMSAGQADAIVAYFRDSTNGWTAITDQKDGSGNVTQRKEEGAKEAADNGNLVLCGLTSAELGAANGHVAVIISAALIFSSSNNDYYPVAYWGTLGGTGGANECLSYSFGTGDIDRVTYFSFAF